MCGIFGFSDTQGILTQKQRQILIRALAVASEERGTDSSGIAYNSGSRLIVYKRPVPAHRFSPRLPNDTTAIIGHTRCATQGNAKYNANNHPFRGKAGYMDFALAHNGVLYNDKLIRREECLPATNIETDSYIAVQLVEKTEHLNVSSLADMAEKISGSFVFTVLNMKNDLYIVKGDNPIDLCCFPNGLYVYASTSEILHRAIHKLSWLMDGGKLISLKNGDILKIRSDGELKWGKFTPTEDWHYFRCGYYSGWDEDIFESTAKPCIETDNDYLEDVIRFARFVGISESEIQLLLDAGMDIMEISDLLYDPDILKEYIDEICCDRRCKNHR